MTPTLTPPPEAAAPPAAEERCDRCSAAGKLRIVLAGGGELVFCGHHANKFAPDLVKIAVEVSRRAGLQLARDRTDQQPRRARGLTGRHRRRGRPGGDSGAPGRVTGRRVSSVDVLPRPGPEAVLRVLQRGDALLELRDRGLRRWPARRRAGAARRGSFRAAGRCDGGGRPPAR